MARAIAGSHDGKHTRKNSEATILDLTEFVEALEQLIPLGPTFAAGR